MAKVYDPVSGKMREAAPPASSVQRVTPAEELVKVRPNPVTGQMTFAGGTPETQKQVINRYADMGYNVGQSNNQKSSAPVDTSYADYLAELKRQQAQQRQNQTEVLRGLLQSYGMSALFDRVKSYIQDGYDADAIMVLIRTTPEYKQRFPAMDALAAKGRAISESDYISYEKTAQNLERRYGLPQGMLMNSVTDLLTNEVSPVELNDRVLLASAASIQAPQEIKNMFQQYYGIDQGGMTAYFLDPDVATPLLEKQFASAVIGAEATRQGIGIDVYGAENLQGLGITQEQARQGFGQVAAAKGLTEGRGDVVTQQELVGSAFNTNAEAQKSVERAIGGRLGRFQGGGEFLQQGGQNVGLGTAATR